MIKITVSALRIKNPSEGDHNCEDHFHLCTCSDNSSLVEKVVSTVVINFLFSSCTVSVSFSAPISYPDPCVLLLRMLNEFSIFVEYAQ